MKGSGGYIDTHQRVGPGRRYEARDLAAALGEMDAGGVEVAWICPTERFMAVLNRDGNDFIRRAIRAHPNRFIGCAVANPWYGEAAVAELERAFGEGLRVLYLNPPTQGFRLTDDLADPLIAMARKFAAPVYVHTGTPICCEPFQLAALAARHPDVPFVMGHAGFADFWYDAIEAARMAGNIFLETSLIDDGIILDAVARLGADRLLFGSSAPLSGVALEAEKILDLPVTDAIRRNILRDNAGGLLP
jgi:predicted TIM-barrel fold metal-dependent hydrolase